MVRVACFVFRTVESSKILNRLQHYFTGRNIAFVKQHTSFLLSRLFNLFNTLATMNRVNEFKPKGIIGFRPSENARRVLGRLKARNRHRTWSSMLEAAITLLGEKEGFK